MLKFNKFFSPNYKYNIYTISGSLLIIVNFFVSNSLLALLALNLIWIPLYYETFTTYKISIKGNLRVIISSIIFLYSIYVLISTIFRI